MATGDRSLNLFVLGFTIFLAFGNYEKECWALQVEISPDTFDAITTPVVTISCRMSPSIDEEAQEVLNLELSKNDGQPIAVMTRSCNESYGSRVVGEREVNAHIDKVPSLSYLNLSLIKPIEEDGGSYRCVLHYLDGEFRLTEKTAEANLTFDARETKKYVRILSKRFWDLEEEMKAKTEDFNRRVDNLNHRMSMLVMQNAEATGKITTMEARVRSLISKQSYALAFSARYNVKGKETKGHTVVFDEIVMNLGEGYNGSTGEFTATKSGIYGFHVSAMLETLKGYIDMGVFVNDEVQAALSCGSDLMHWDQSSTSIFVHLKPKDVVKVKAFAKIPGMRLRAKSNHYTVFSGYLFQQTDV